MGDEADLNTAIECYNAKVAGNYTITLTQNISLTVSSTIIDNATSNTTLLLEGGDFTLDGQDIAGVRPIEIATNTEVTLQNMTIIGGNSSNGGGISNSGTLTVSNSTFSGNSAASIGGGISNDGTLTVSNSTLSGNSATVGGGILNVGTLTVSNSTLPRL